MEIEISSAHLRVKSDRKVTSPLPRLFPKYIHRNFEVAIFLKLVLRSYNENSGIDTTRQSPGTGVVDYALGAVFVLYVCICKCVLKTHLPLNHQLRGVQTVICKKGN